MSSGADPAAAPAPGEPPIFRGGRAADAGPATAPALCDAQGDSGQAASPRRADRGGELDGAGEAPEVERSSSEEPAAYRPGRAY